MKTSLKIDDSVFQEAKKASLQSGKTVSEIINQWASLGRQVWKKQSTQRSKKKFTPVDLGQQLIDVSNRKSWMAVLEKNDRR
ncbi:MAG: hypothetical protein HYS98_03425 [Deltaproteobacteria bacterium]|nr:hypothetical protein [Deltaproteobacteria bacterium]